MKQLLFLFSICFIVYKAWSVPFTHDESLSYLNYVPGGFMDIISYAQFNTNNHILNTLLMKYSEQIFGTCELALRLPNITAFLIFFYAIRRIIPNPENWSEYLLIGLVVLNSATIDYFAIARGYGLSFAFMVLSIFFLKEMLHNGKGRHIIGFHVASLLASLSNFTLLSFYLAAGLFYMTYRFVFHRPIKLNLPYHLFGFSFSVLTLWEPVRRVIKYNDLGFGGNEGLFSDTICDMAKTITQGTVSNEAILFLLAVFIVMVIFGSFLWGVKSISSGFLFNQEHLTFSSILLLLFIIIEAQHVILSNDYPILRFSHYLSLLFLLNAIFLLFKLKLKSLNVLLVLLSFCFFIFSFRLDYLGEWSYDRNTKRVVEFLSEQDKEHIRLGSHPLFEPSLNFYIQYFGIDNIDSVPKENIRDHHEFLYVLESDYLNIHSDTLLYFNNTGSILISRK